MQIKDIVAGRKFITKNGEERTKWVTVGYLFIKDDGHFSLKLEDWVNPVAFRNEKGEVWLNVFDQKEKKEEQAPQSPKRGEAVNVVRDAQAYAEKWRKEAERKQAMENAPDENYFMDRPDPSDPTETMFG